MCRACVIAASIGVLVAVPDLGSANVSKPGAGAARAVYLACEHGFTALYFSDGRVAPRFCREDDPNYGSIALRNLHWSHWGTGAAHATGRASYGAYQQDPDTSTSDPVTVTASSRVYTGSCCGGISINRTFYVKLTVVSHAYAFGGAARTEIFNTSPGE